MDDDNIFNLDIDDFEIFKYASAELCDTPEFFKTEGLTIKIAGMNSKTGTYMKVYIGIDKHFVRKVVRQFMNLTRDDTIREWIAPTEMPLSERKVKTDG